MVVRPRLAVLIAALASCGDDAATGGAAPTSTTSTTDATTTSSTVSSTSATTGLPETFVVHGVVTDGTAPLEGAIVMQGGGDPLFVTGSDGTFSVTLGTAISGIPTVVAAKVGHRSSGYEVYELDDAPIELVLYRADPPDNAAYVFGDPGTGDPLQDSSSAVCGHCHTTYVRDFLGSAHARATRDPTVQDVYAGVASSVATAACDDHGGTSRQGLVPGSPGTAQTRCYVENGVLGDLNPCGGPGDLACDDPARPAADRPTRFGGCADCHAIGIDGVAGGRNLHDATGIAFEKGNHCDTCHHVRQVDLARPAGNAGRLVMQRPSERTSDDVGAKLRQVMFGPYLDVPNAFMGGSYQPQFSEATFCAGCHLHHQEALVPGQSLDVARWPSGLPVHDTFTEWSDSTWASTNTPCQTCHMPDVLGLTNAVDITTPDDASIAFGFARDPDDLHAHTFRGPLSVDGGVRFIDGAVGMSIVAMRAGNDVEVAVSIENAGAGHAIPTGEPMRALVLVVDVDGCGTRFTASGGATIADLGGAVASATVGVDASFAGTALTIAPGKIAPGDVVRVVRATGAYDDYDGIGFFADPTLTPEEKGIASFAPVGDATVVAIATDGVVLDRAIDAAIGDVIYVGASTDSLGEDAPAAALAGAAGNLFHKVLLDADGTRGVPHHRAVDIQSDNRIAPHATVVSSHAFAVPPGCTSATTTARLVYRPLPHGLARRFGWDARDHVVATASVVTAL